MYLVDQLDNRYDHVETRGAAAFGGRLDHRNPDGPRGLRFPTAPLRRLPLHVPRRRSEHLDIEHRGRSLGAHEPGGKQPATRARPRRTNRPYPSIPGRGWVVLTPTNSFSRKPSPASAEPRDSMPEAPLPLRRSPFPPLRSTRSCERSSKSPLIEREYVPTFTHTDDYPSISIEKVAEGETVVFRTESQGEGHVPWAVESKGKTFVIPTDTPARALEILGPYLRREPPMTASAGAPTERPRDRVEATADELRLGGTKRRYRAGAPRFWKMAPMSIPRTPTTTRHLSPWPLSTATQR